MRWNGWFGFCGVAASLAAGFVTVHAQTPHLLRQPAISQDEIAFRYAADIWTVGKGGGTARRLTSSGDVEDGPFFSPDGKTIAYGAHAAGVPQIFTIPATGGVPKQITFHPGGNFLSGWTPDGKSLLMNSMQDAVRTYFEMYKVRADGTGLPERLPVPSAYEGTLSPDGARLAYNPYLQWQAESWKRYRGGQTEPVWIVDLKTLDMVKVPRENSNDTNPVWVADTVYFLSDRNGPVSLFAYDVKTKAVKQVVENHGLDLKTLNGRAGELVYEQFGTIHLVEMATGQEHEVKVQLDGDLPKLEPRIAKIGVDEIQNVGISPTGVRGLFEAHGEIFTVPAEKGDVRNLTNTSGAAEREPAWSPDGRRVCYFSDASGEYKLYLRDQDGLTAPKVIDLGPDPTYYYAPAWSPDSRKIVFSDKRLNLWYVDVEGNGKPVKVDMDLREGFGPSGFSASFSPDSKWILYARSLPNLENAAFLYSLETGKTTQMTDGMSDVKNPVWDAGGKYVFFTASTDIGPAIDGFGLGSFNRTTTASVYVAVLNKDDVSPIPPESDDEKVKSEEKAAPTDAGKSEEKKDAAKGVADGKKPAAPAAPVTTPVVKIDLENIQQRILALPIPARNYTALLAGKTGVLLLGEGGAAANSAAGGNGDYRSVWRFTLESRKTEDVLHNVGGMVISFDGEKLLYRKGEGYFLAGGGDLTPAAADGMPGKPLKMDGMQAKIDPRAEWKQMYAETWRIEREFFYDPGFHGLDLKKIEAKYRPYVDGLSTRSDLTYLQQEMLGEMTVGHMFVSGPSTPNAEPKNGLLGADYGVDHNRYKFTHVVSGGNWNPQRYSPLTQPGVNVKEGEYLLAVNGVELYATDNVYAAFEGMAGKQVSLTVGPNADGTGSRRVLVIPVDSERAMRSQEWIDGNIRKVDQMTGGKVAYVYLPDTGASGFNSFNRYFFAQTEKKAVIVDDRYNQGGDIADYVIDVLKRTPMLNYESRQGLRTTEPTGAIFGPKVMLINQNAGSGGDAMPWLFRQAKLGPLVGTRTWGGLVGIGGYPTLLDGGSVTAPRTALYGLTGEFEVENHGIAPDVEVEEMPLAVEGGQDPQLEKAVAIVMEELKKNPPKEFPVPIYPNYHQKDGLGR